jgi:uncharacterized protein YsxB (DUF464 family)
MSANGSNSEVESHSRRVRSTPMSGHGEFGAQGPKVPCSEIAPLSTVLALKAGAEPHPE